MNILSPAMWEQSTGRTSDYSGLAFQTFACSARPGMDNEMCQVISDACSNGSSPAVTFPTVDDSNDVTKERTTQKGCRKASKGKNDENWRYCVQECLHSGKSPNELIQRHMCQSWIHPECVVEDGKDIVGIWTCTSCRQLLVLVSRLLEKTSAPESLIEKLTCSNQHLVALVVEQRQDLRKWENQQSDHWHYRLEPPSRNATGRQQLTAWCPLRRPWQ